MGITPDRAPGPREEEELQLEDQGSGATPSIVGALLQADGEVLIRDSLGVYNPRSGGGISEEDHEALDHLTHLINESSYDEYTYSGVKVTNVITWTNSGKTKKVRELQISYSGSKVSQTISIQYDGDGVEEERLTEVYAYSGMRIDTVTRTKA